MVAMRSVRSVSALIFEPLMYVHAIPSSFTLSFSQSLQTPTLLFSAALYSTLRTPISPPPSFETTPVGSFLLNECGFSVHETNSICTRRPDLLRHKSFDNSRQTLLFLRDKGFHEVDVRKLFFKVPDILRSSFQNTVKPKVEFLEKIGLTGQNLSKALSRGPSILLSSISCTLKPRVCFLQSVLDSELAAVVSNPESDKISGKLVSSHSLTVYVVSTNPRILLFPSDEILVGLVKDIEEMGIEKRSKAFARVLTRFCSLSRDTFKRKLENLRQLGFIEEEVGILLKKFPTLLGLSEDRLRQNLTFLVEEWKLARNFVLSYPAALGYSMEKRLKPRLSALRASMMKDNSSKKAFSYSLGYFITMPEKDFQLKVVGKLTA